MFQSDWPQSKFTLHMQHFWQAITNHTDCFVHIRQFFGYRGIVVPHVHIVQWIKNIFSQETSGTARLLPTNSKDFFKIIMIIKSNNFAGPLQGVSVYGSLCVGSCSQGQDTFYYCKVKFDAECVVAIL